MNITENFYIRELSNEEILNIYQTTAPLHFPKEELRPLFNIKHIMHRNGYKGIGLYITDSAKSNAPKSDSSAKAHALAGYAFFITAPDSDVLLLDYFAILEEYRCLGLGGHFLQNTRNHFQNILGILIETEDIACASSREEKSLRKRRNDFYIRNGAISTGLHNTLGTVPYEIFFLPVSSLKPASQPQDLRARIETIYRFMLQDETEISYEKIVRWREA